jgi:hypothetical protein
LENKRKLKVVDNGYGFWRVKKKGWEGRQRIVN